MSSLSPQIPVAVAAVDLPVGGRAAIVEVNDAFRRFFGLAAGADVAAALADESWLQVLQRDEVVQQLRADRPCTYCVPGQRVGTGECDLEVTAARVQDGPSEPLRVLVTLVDATERVRAERALRESEQRFRNLAANVPGAIFRYTLHRDGTDEVVFLNRGCEDLWAISAEQLSGDPRALWAMVDAEDLPGLQQSVEESARTLDPWVFEWRMTTPDGRRKWVQGSGRPERRADGSVAWDSLILDVSAIRRAEAAGRISEARLRSLFAESPAGMAIFDHEGRYTHANPTLARMNGVPADAHIGRRPRDLFDPELAAGIERGVESILAGGPAALDLEIAGETRAAPGELRHWMFSEFPIRDDGGQRIGVGVVVLETTALKRAEAERSELEARLLQAQRLESVGRLAGGIAHDFNNLLTVILANVDEAAAAAVPGSAQSERLAEVRNAARRSAELTRQLLAFARRQVVTPRVLALDEELGGMFDLLRRLVGERIELTWRPGAPDGNVEIDLGQLSQIVTNLVVNARDALEDGGRIRVSTSMVDIEASTGRLAQCAPGPYVCITVADDGSGMDADTQAHMFEPFFTTKSGGRGSGLGLATVHGIVLQNRGCIDVRSSPGAGSTFDVYLPRHAGRVTPVAEAARAVRPSTSASGAVLLVEDEPAILELARRILEQLGYSVFATTSALEALALGSKPELHFDLLVTDVVMPELNGRDLAAKLVAMRPGLRVLYLSGYFHEFAPPVGGSVPRVGFLPKPFTAIDLEAKVREAMAQR